MTKLVADLFTIATLGGLLLTAGAFLSFKGMVYQAVATYLFADVCWIWLAYDKGDYQGVAFTVVGTLLGLAAFIKMYLGIMRKDLKLDTEVTAA